MRRLTPVLVVFLAGCAPMAEMIQNAGQPTAHTVSTTGQSIEQAQLVPYNGPKARVAVSRFSDRTAKGSGIVYGYPLYTWYTPQIGNGMAEMLSDALLQSNRFIVLDRQAVQDVLQEQDLATAGRVSSETAAKTGQVEGADLLVKGAITEFEPGSAGAGAGGVLGAFGLPGAILGGILAGVRQSHVAMIIQVVDARTSRILFSTTVEGKANDFDIGGALGGFGGGVGGLAGLGTWQKTPVEKAIRVAILQAVKELSAKTPQTYFRHDGETKATAPTVSTNPQIPSVPTMKQVSYENTTASLTGRPTFVLPSTLKVKANIANLRDAPGRQSNVIATLKQGTKLSVQGEDKGWYLVQTVDQRTGWISRSLTTSDVY